MLDSGVKSGLLIQLLGQAASGTHGTSPSSPLSISALCKQVFDSAVKGDDVAVVAALQVIFDCMRICLPVVSTVNLMVHLLGNDASRLHIAPAPTAAEVRWNSSGICNFQWCLTVSLH